MHNPNPNLLYYLEKGNNSGVVKRVLSIRNGWSEATTNFGKLNLKWTQTLKGSLRSSTGIYNSKDGIQIINHLIGNDEICNKDKLWSNVKSFCLVIIYYCI